MFRWLLYVPAVLRKCFFWSSCAVISNILICLLFRLVNDVIQHKIFENHHTLANHTDAKYARTGTGKQRTRTKKVEALWKYWWTIVRTLHGCREASAHFVQANKIAFIFLKIASCYPAYELNKGSYRNTVSYRHWFLNFFLRLCVSQCCHVFWLV